MPNSIFFTKEGHAIHGTFEARNLGRAASHGCVRLSTQNAATLYALVKEEGVFNTRVRLVGEAPRDDDTVARRNNDASRNRDYVRNYTTDSDDFIDPSFQRSRQRAGTTTARVPTIIARNRIMYAATTAAVITHSGGERGSLRYPQTRRRQISALFAQEKFPTASAAIWAPSPARRRRSSMSAKSNISSGTTRPATREQPTTNHRDARRRALLRHGQG